LFGSKSAWRACRHDDVNLETDQIGDKIGNRSYFPSAHRYSIVMSGLGVAELAETLAECVHEIGFKEGEELPR